MKIRIIVLSLLCTACSMAPKYQQPEMPVADQFNSEQSAEYQAIAWQDFVLDAQLESLIQQALENNRDLRIAALNVQKLQAQYRIQKSEQWPNLGVNGAAQHQHLPDHMTTAPNGTSHTYQMNLGLAAYELDLFGRVNSLSRAALQQYIASEEAQRSVQISLIAELSNRYIEYMAAVTELDLLRQDTDSSEELYRLIQRRVENGIDNPAAEAQARALLQTVRIRLLQKEQSVVELFNSIQLLAGGAVTLEKPDMTKAVVLQAIPAGLPADLLQNRPDIREAEAQLKAANANIGAARANFFPRISLTANAGVASTSLSELFESGSEAWLFTPQIYLPIFHAGANKANLKKAQIERDIAVANYDKRIQTAFKEVADQLHLHTQLQGQRAASDEQLDAVKTVYDLTEKRYRQGVESHFNVIQAYRDVLDIQQQNIDLNRQLLASRINLYKVLGGGWQGEQPLQQDQSSAQENQ